MEADVIFFMRTELDKVNPYQAAIDELSKSSKEHFALAQKAMDEFDKHETSTKVGAWWDGIAEKSNIAAAAIGNAREHSQGLMREFDEDSSVVSG